MISGIKSKCSLGRNQRRYRSPNRLSDGHTHCKQSARGQCCFGDEQRFTTQTSGETGRTTGCATRGTGVGHQNRVKTARGTWPLLAVTGGFHPPRVAVIAIWFIWTGCTTSDCKTFTPSEEGCALSITNSSKFVMKANACIHALGVASILI
jgi:hypothetical protein